MKNFFSSDIRENRLIFQTPGPERDPRPSPTPDQLTGGEGVRRLQTATQTLTTRMEAVQKQIADSGLKTKLESTAKTVQQRMEDLLKKQGTEVAELDAEIEGRTTRLFDAIRAAEATLVEAEGLKTNPISLRDGGTDADGWQKFTFDLPADSLQGTGPTFGFNGRWEDSNRAVSSTNATVFQAGQTDAAVPAGPQPYRISRAIVDGKCVYTLAVNPTLRSLAFRDRPAGVSIGTSVGGPFRTDRLPTVSVPRVADALRTMAGDELKQQVEKSRPPVVPPPAPRLEPRPPTPERLETPETTPAIPAAMDASQSLNNVAVRPANAQISITGESAMSATTVAGPLSMVPESTVTIGALSIKRNSDGTVNVVANNYQNIPQNFKVTINGREFPVTLRPATTVRPPERRESDAVARERMMTLARGPLSVIPNVEIKIDGFNMLHITRAGKPFPSVSVGYTLSTNSFSTYVTTPISGDRVSTRPLSLTITEANLVSTVTNQVNANLDTPVTPPTPERTETPAATRLRMEALARGPLSAIPNVEFRIDGFNILHLSRPGTRLPAVSIGYTASSNTFSTYLTKTVADRSVTTTLNLNIAESDLVASVTRQVNANLEAAPVAPTSGLEFERSGTRVRMTAEAKVMADRLGIIQGSRVVAPDGSGVWTMEEGDTLSFTVVAGKLQMQSYDKRRDINVTYTFGAEGRPEVSRVDRMKIIAADLAADYRRLGVSVRFENTSSNGARITLSKDGRTLVFDYSEQTMAGSGRTDTVRRLTSQMNGGPVQEMSAAAGIDSFKDIIREFLKPPPGPDIVSEINGTEVRMSAAAQPIVARLGLIRGRNVRTPGPDGKSLWNCDPGDKLEFSVDRGQLVMKGYDKSRDITTTFTFDASGEATVSTVDRLRVITADLRGEFRAQGIDVRFEETASNSVKIIATKGARRLVIDYHEQTNVDGDGRGMTIRRYTTQLDGGAVEPLASPSMAILREQIGRLNTAPDRTETPALTRERMLNLASGPLSRVPNVDISIDGFNMLIVRRRGTSTPSISIGYTASTNKFSTYLTRTVGDRFVTTPLTSDIAEANLLDTVVSQVNINLVTPPPDLRPSPDTRDRSDTIATELNKLGIIPDYNPGAKELAKSLGISVVGDSFRDGLGTQMCKLDRNDRVIFTVNASGDLRIYAAGSGEALTFIVHARDVTVDGGTRVWKKGEHVDAGQVGIAERQSLRRPDDANRQLLASPTDLSRRFEVFSMNGGLTINARKPREDPRVPKTRALGGERNPEGGWDITLEGDSTFKKFEWQTGQDLNTVVRRSADGDRWIRRNEAMANARDPMSWDANTLRTVLKWTDDKGKTGYFIFSRMGTSAQSVLSVCTDGVQQFDMRGVGGPRIVARKPVIYLYPTKPTDVMVDVTLTDMLFTAQYPKMKNGAWKVNAKPDGELTDAETGKKYSYLFWEANATKPWTLDDSKAHCVAGGDAESFLEQSLATLGLNVKERNDFLVYWLPKLETNDFSLIHFVTDEYETRAKLDVMPVPDSVIRVFMVFKSAKKAVATTPAALKPGKRSGFTVVEWGGTDLDEGDKVA